MVEPFKIGGIVMKISDTKYRYKCNCCGKLSKLVYECPKGWKSLPYSVHYCPECINKRQESEAINLINAVIGDKFLTRAGKEAILINVLNGHKNNYVFADDSHVWATLSNGFVSTVTADDIIKKIKTKEE